MMVEWEQFLRAIKDDPKNFAKYIVEFLDPPKYAVEQLKSFGWMCHFCWKPRVDICYLCQRSVCEEHIAKTLVGPKTKLEWYLCPDCLKITDMKDFETEVKEEDEQFWLEDQEEKRREKNEETA